MFFSSRRFNRITYVAAAAAATILITMIKLVASRSTFNERTNERTNGRAIVRHRFLFVGFFRARREAGEKRSVAIFQGSPTSNFVLRRDKVPRANERRATEQRDTARLSKRPDAMHFRARTLKSNANKRKMKRKKEKEREREREREK